MSGRGSRKGLQDSISGNLGALGGSGKVNYNYIKDLTKFASLHHLNKLFIQTGLDTSQMTGLPK